MEMLIGQLRYAAASFLYGAALMLVYDLIRILRSFVKHNLVAKWAEDWGFWVAASVVVFRMIFALNFGIMRTFFVLAFFFGMWIYRRLAGDRPVKAGRKFFHILFLPITKIRQKVGKTNKKSLK